MRGKDRVTVALDGFHICRVGSDVAVVFETITTTGNRGLVDFIFFGANVNSIRGIRKILLAGTASWVNHSRTPILLILLGENLP